MKYVENTLVMSKSRYESDIYTIRNIHKSLDSDIIEMDNSNTTTNKCELCSTESDSKFIILNCGHLFHVGCIVEHQLRDIFKYENIDEGYFSNTLCNVCETIVDKEDLLIIHTKYMSSTETILEAFTNNLNLLEFELKKLRDKIKGCLCEKHKLQQSREKSKHIISILDASF